MAQCPSAEVKQNLLSIDGGRIFDLVMMERKGPSKIQNMYESGFFCLALVEECILHHLVRHGVYMPDKLRSLQKVIMV